MPYRITTESTADLSPERMQELEVAFAMMGFSIGDVAYLDDMRPSTVQHLYDSMREGSDVCSYQVNTDSFLALWEPLLKEGYDILHLSFPVAMSGTYNSGRIARDQLMLQYPEREIIHLDSLSGSSGQGMLVELAVEEKRSGKTLEELQAFVMDIRTRINHWFTLDNLVYLKRGGRISGTVALVASLLNIKPIMTLTEDGRLINSEKVKGRRGSIKRLLSLLNEKVDTAATRFINICHSDCMEEAQSLKQDILQRYPGLAVRIYNVGAAIGSHVGPGALAVFFVGRPNTRMT